MVQERDAKLAAQGKPRGAWCAADELNAMRDERDRELAGG
jgi:hypothetical protein